MFADSSSIKLKGGPLPGQPADSSAASTGAIALLAQGEITGCEPLFSGSNGVYLLSLKLCGENARAVYKPRRGERPLWDFPNGTLYQREYAAYLVSQVLQWYLIPPTVIRSGPYGVGMVQWFIATGNTSYYTALLEKHLSEFKKITTFDWLVNNADRKSGHCLEAPGGRLWFIDHGLTFHVIPKLRTVIWDFAEQPVPPELLADLAQLRQRLTGSDALMTTLSQLILPEELQALRQRLEMILSNPVFPSSFGSYRRTPWPPF